MNGARRVDDSLALFRVDVFPAQNLVKRSQTAEIAGGRMNDLTVEEMDFATAIVFGPKMQNRRRQIQALERDEIARAEIAQSPAGITGSRRRPRTEQRLDGCAKFGKLERFLDELNRSRSVPFGIQFPRNARRDGEKTSVRICGGDPIEEFNRVWARRIEIDDQERRTRFNHARLGLGQGFDRANAVLWREFLQRRSNGGGERIVFFDEKNAKRCPGRRFVGSRHGGSERKGRE